MTSFGNLHLNNLNKNERIIEIKGSKYILGFEAVFKLKINIINY